MADVVDLFVSEQSRHCGALYLLFCDEQNRVALPMVFDDVDVGQPEDCRERLVPILAMVGQRLPGGSVVAALGRRGLPRVTAVDLEWMAGVRDACERVQTRLLGFYVAVPDGILNGMP